MTMQAWSTDPGGANYCIIAPDQGGRGKAGNYNSADEEYKQLKQYLAKKNE